MNKRTFLKLAMGSLVALKSSTLFAMQSNQIPDKYAIIFFFSSNCEYCHRFSPKLRQLQAQTGVPVYDFSLNNAPIPEFPQPIPVDEEIYYTFFPTSQSNDNVPATFLINVNSMKFVRMTIGDVSYQQLTQSFTNIIKDPAALQAIE